MTPDQIERLLAALEGIQAELVEAREHPRFMPTGMMIVKENSPEHLAAKFGANVPGSGIRGGPQTSHGR